MEGWDSFLVNCIVLHPALGPDRTWNRSFPEEG